MYARVTIYQCDPKQLEGMAAQMPAIKKAVETIEGILSTYTVWRADGQGVTMSIYISEAAADQAAEQVKAVWTDMAGYIVHTPVIEAYDNVAHIKG